jgi:hypothetical protein
MCGVTEPAPLQLTRLRSQITELSAAVRQLHQAGLDNAAAEVEVLLLRRRVELEGVLRGASGPGRFEPARTAGIAGQLAEDDRRPGS